MSVVVNMAKLMSASHVVCALEENYRFDKLITGRELQFEAWSRPNIEAQYGAIQVSRFSISLLPGCAHIVVFHGVTVRPELRHRGVGTRMHQLRLAIAREYGATLALCTVIAGNSVEKRILEANGWVKSHDVAVGVEMWSNNLGRSE